MTTRSFIFAMVIIALGMTCPAQRAVAGPAPLPPSPVAAPLWPSPSGLPASASPSPSPSPSGLPASAPPSPSPSPSGLPAPASPSQSPSPSSTSPSATPSPSPSPLGMGAEAARILRRQDTQTQRRDKVPFTPWPGSFPLGRDTRMKIGGFLELDALSTSGVMGSRGQFITASIATGAANRGSATALSVNPSRLWAETRSVVDGRRVTVYGAFDMFAASQTVVPRWRLREAYVEIANALFGGDIRIGQSWSSVADLESYPNVLDFEGPNSFLGLRVPLIRWSRAFDGGFKLTLSAESPFTHSIQNAPSYTALPDGVATFTWDRDPYMLQAAFVARDLRASANSAAVARALGWGASLTGKIFVSRKKKDFITFSATYGRGIGSDFNDSPVDAVYVSKSGGNSLEPIPAFGGFVGYEHVWSPSFSSTACYGVLDVSSLGLLSSSQFARTRYGTLNLVWTPSASWLLGIEGQYGRRVNFSGDAGNVFRTQMTTRFTF